MDVVLGSVAVSDIEFLIDLDAQHVWCVVATILIELDGSRRYRPAIVAKLLAAFDGAVLDINKRVGEFAIFNDGVVGHQIRILLAADGIGGRVDLLWCRRCAVI